MHKKQNTVQEKYLKPKSVQEALKMLSEYETGFRFVAGATDFLVNKFQGNENGNIIIDVTGIDELKEVKIKDSYLSIGSLVKLDDLKKNVIIVKDFFSLIEAANTVATPVIRKTATLGGNIMVENRCSFYNQSEWWREAVGYCLKCNGDICIATGGKNKCFSKFVSDTVPVLICLDAMVEVVGTSGGYISRVEDIYTGDGINSKKIKTTELIKSILIPLKNNEAKIVFKKLRQRESIEFTSLTSAVSLNKKKITIALSGVDPKPVIIHGVIGDLIPELIAAAIKKARLVDNDVFSRDYRKEMISVFLKQSFEELKLLNGYSN